MSNWIRPPRVTTQSERDYRALVVDYRALVVALLLREGRTVAQVSAVLKATDAGGSVVDAFAAMREAGSRS